MGDTVATRVAYGKYLKELGATNTDIVVLDADLAVTTNTNLFRDAYPDRFFDCGIQECNMVGMAAGLAAMGKTPFVSTFAIFGSGRAYEIVRNAIAYPNLNVKFCLTHAGITVGEDGASHQSIEDIALMRVIPNMTVFVPSDATQVKQAMDAALSIDGPVYIRLSRFATDVLPEKPFTPGKAQVLREGTDVTLVACGLMVEACLKAAEQLAQKGIEATVLNLHTIKPFDEETVVSYAQKTKKVLIVEEHSVIGGLGDATATALCGKGTFAFKKLGLQDVFGESGTAAALLESYGLTPENIVKEVMSL